MTGNVVQVDYDQLEQIAQRLARSAEATSDLDRRLRQAVAALADGGWIGRGSDAFFQDMSTEVLPAHTRLITALHEGVAVTRQISQTMRQAEAEAAGLFQSQGGGESASSGTSPGSASPSQPSNNPQPAFIAPIRPGGSMLDRINANGLVWQSDHRSKSGKFDPALKLTVKFENDSAKVKDGVAKNAFTIEAGLKADKSGVLIGAGGEFYSVKGEWDTAFVGDKEYGVTGSAGFKGPGVEGFAGIKLDGDNPRIGATVGVNIASIDGSIGANIAGHNVSVTGEIGLKAEFGLNLSKKGLEVKLPFVSFGLSFGQGRD